MLNWLLSLILPATMPLEGSKKPLETLSTTGEGVDNPKSK